MNKFRYAFGRTASAVLITAAFAGAAHAQDYPTERITIVVGFSAGGFADTIGRVVGEALGARLGQTVTIENQAGAGGNIAAARVANAAPDGYTLLMTTTAIAISPSVEEELTYDIDALAVVAIPALAPESLSVHPSHPANNLAEFVEWAKEQGEVNFASGGANTGSHLSAEYILKVAGVNAVHIPYQGGAQSIQAVMGNQVDMVASGNSAYAQIRQGTLKGIGIASAERLEILPDVPTYIESGYDFEAASWGGFFAPAGTDPDIVAFLNREINAAIESPEVHDRLAGQGFVLSVRDLAETQQYFADEIANWAMMVETLNADTN